MLIVFTTVSNIEQGETLAEKLVEKKLAACVQILPQMTSVYFWEGEIQKDKERLLLIKTDDRLFDEVSGFLTEHHPYSTPEIVAVEAEKISGPYRKWIEGYLRS